MGISYEDFISWEVSNKITFIEDWFFQERNLENISERDLKKFFRKILENEQVGYIKVLAIETLIFLTTLNKIRKVSTLDMLLDIENEDDSFVIITMLRYLTMFFEEQNDILEKIDSLKGHEDPEVSSEAYFRLGLLKFLECNTFNNKVEYIDSLNKSIQLFNYSRNQIENRTDAEYFYHVTKFIEALVITNEKQIEESYESLFNSSYTRQAFHINDKLLAVEYKINKILYNLKHIFDSTNSHHEWINFYNEFNKLSTYHYEIIECSLSGNEFQKRLLSKLKHQINENIAQNMYLNSFRYYESRITTILNSYSSDHNLNVFLNYLLELVRKKDKKKDEIDVVETCAKIDNLIQGYTKESKIIELINKFKTTHDIENLDDILKVIAQYTESIHANNFGYITGFDVGEEIFYRLYKSIRTELPNYDNEKLQIFMQIIEEVIRYLILTVRYKRDEVFGYLYTEKHGGKGDRATERDLQDSLLKHFHYSPIAYGASEEENNFADGGRIDIVYKINNYTFPIELKKTKQKISVESIQEKYLEQVHSYIYSYQQLGIFVLLDLNEKDKPVNDVRELVYLDHLEPLYDLKNKYPNNIVVVIIPGNKPLPSDKSTYR
ncbi:hypothetical protein AB3N04_06105 [Alkalihalophilus sp. As8PL]|uniref:Protein NO VEIN C-terminal domain-containing protein n=1 Tax=Alkalihalophilus sp. As8PL TaxID=3237103 RepID=A0AB39BWU1_9BACI